VVNSIAKFGRTFAVMAVLAAGAVALGLLAAWFMGVHGGAAAVPAAGGAGVSAPPVEAVPAGSYRPIAARSRPPDASAPVANHFPSDFDSRTAEEKLEEVLLAAGDPNSKADKILALMATASPDDQVELSRHLINMVQDDHYDGTAEVLTNASTQPAVATVLMNDLLNRHNTLKLPMLLAVAQNSDHPLAGQAKDMLELFLQTDYGTNWGQWSTAVGAWLQANEQ
jgi:hypothetical protein